MSRYIDAKWLQESLELADECKDCKRNVDKCVYANIDVGVVCNAVDDAPSIDIVFCKECKYRIHTPAAPNKNRPCETHPELNNCGLRKGLKPQVKLYDFCSYGKRRVINDEM